MKIATLLIAALTAVAPLAHAAENRLANSDFSGSAAGSPPAKPWLYTKDAPGITIKLETLPAGKAGNTDPAKLWVHLVDGSTEQPAGIRQNFDPVPAGRLQWKVYFQQLGSSFAVLLGDPNVSKPENLVFVVKMNARGQVVVGEAANRNKTPFAFRTGQIYDVYCNFKPSADGKTMAVEVGLTGGETIFSGVTEVVRPVSGLRLTSDGAGTGLDAFVTDVTLTVGG